MDIIQISLDLILYHKVIHEHTFLGGGGGVGGGGGCLSMQLSQK